ncbi:hypothetical protein BVY01_00265 [bacterium I07]|nr:hypothetical protein BVY01_00265 [bacterium I07]
MPFFMGCNETKYAWMDEGFATFTTNLIKNVLVKTRTSRIRTDWWNTAIYSGMDVPIYVYSNLFKESMAYYANSFLKAGLFLQLLSDYLGEDFLISFIQEFMMRWNGKHPMPYDFFFTLNEESGQNLNWLIKPCFFEYGYPDLAIGSVNQVEGEYSIVIEKKGNYPVPIDLEILFEDSTATTHHEKVSVWKDNNKTHTIVIQIDKPILQIKLKSEFFPDAVKEDNNYQF